MKRDIGELIFNEGTAWEFLSKWIKEANNKVCVLESHLYRGKEILRVLQITNKSSLGSIALQTGGLLIDNGWLKILGSGNENICGNIISWNGFEETRLKHRVEGPLIVAYDIIGGFFVINAGAFSGPLKQMYYFAPEKLEWEMVKSIKYYHLNMLKKANDCCKRLEIVEKQELYMRLLEKERKRVEEMLK